MISRMFTRKAEREACFLVLEAFAKKIDATITREDFEREIRVDIVKHPYACAFSIGPGASGVLSWYTTSRDAKYPRTMKGVNTFHYGKATQVFNSVEELYARLEKGFNTCASQEESS